MVSATVNAHYGTEKVGVRQALPNEPGYLHLLRGELDHRGDGAFADSFPGGPVQPLLVMPDTTHEWKFVPPDPG